jgi:hypothetical protein
MTPTITSPTSPAVAVVLKQVRELLSDPTKWTQGTSARDASGNAVDPKDPAATCFCVYGAVHHFAPNDADAAVAFDALDPFVDTVTVRADRSLISVNDGAVALKNDLKPRDAVLSVLDAALANGGQHG